MTEVQTGKNEYTKEEFISLFFDEQVPFSYKFIFVVTMGLYIISPIDFLPEGLFGFFGFADDFGIFFAGMQVFTYFANKHLEKLHEQRVQNLPPESRARVQAAENQAHVVQQQAQSAEQQAEEAQYRALEVRQQEESKALPEGTAVVPSSETPPGAPPKKPENKPQQPAPPPKPPTSPEREQKDYLHDEWHEKFIAEKRRRNDDEFNELVRRRKEESDAEDDWDFSRNDPFAKRRKS